MPCRRADAPILAGTLSIGMALAAPPFLAGPASLVKDINERPAWDMGSFPRGFGSLGGITVFVATTPGTGAEIFRTDGTEAGTRLIRDILAGPQSSFGQSQNTVEFVEFAGSLFFVANDGAHGYELWKTDGTEQGTVLVKDIHTGSGHSLYRRSDPYDEYAFDLSLLHVAAGGALLFVADDSVHGYELWRTDGTEAGTTLLKDILAGPGTPFASFSLPLVFEAGAIDGSVLFRAHDGIHGSELWKSDGTEVGTLLLKEIRPGAAGSDPGPFFAVAGNLLFTARDGTHGPEIWRSDGSADGTVFLAEIYADSGVACRGSLFFMGCEEATGCELWKSDGTEAGTVLLKDIWPGPGHSLPLSFTVFHDTLFFTADDGMRGNELWKSDGTEEGTVLVRDVHPGQGHSLGVPELFREAGGTLFFSAFDGVEEELWKTDGTEDGTVMVKDVRPGPVSSSPEWLTAVDGTLFFTAQDAAPGDALWKSDGTEEGTVLVEAGLKGFDSLAEVAGFLLFSAYAPGRGWEPWRSDGTEEGTFPLQNIAPGDASSFPGMFTVAGKFIAFAADDGTSGREPWIANTAFLLGSSLADTPPAGVSAEGWRSVLAQLDQEVAELSASDAAAVDYFGYSVSISGDTVVVGAQGNAHAGTFSGAAYVFERNLGGANNWGQVRKLIPPDAAAGDEFGASVSISGDTVVVGAPFNDDAGSASGSAYVFGRNTGGADSWGQVRKLTAFDAAAGDQFGISASISGDTLVVGADADDGVGVNTGSVYLFERNVGGADQWGVVTKLTASDAASSDNFGSSLSISGDTAVVGAENNDDTGSSSGSAYVFERNLGGAESWDQVAKLTASDAAVFAFFGYSVSISGDTVVVGAYGNGDAGSESGAAYVFERNAGGADSWDEVAKLTPSDAAADDVFGNSVAISGDTAIVGAPAYDDLDGRPGSAYVFSTNGCSWAQIAKPTANDAAGGDQFGHSASISGDTAVVGAPFEDPVGTNSGSAYVFVRNQGGADGWDQLAKLIASDAATGDNFGNSVSISGDTAVVGAWHANPSGAGDAGAAYVFERNAVGADQWDQVAKLTATPVDPLDFFGYSVSISGDTIVVGAYGYFGVGASSGTAYVFERNKGGANAWDQVAQLLASDQLTSDFFGTSVSISGDTIVVGAYGNDDAGSSSGSAYVFGRNVGGADAWDQRTKLTAFDAAAGDQFGISVSISGDTLVVGANADDVVGVNSGSAYVFERNVGGADQWGVVTKLTASDAAASDFFGGSLSISVDTAVVGAWSQNGVGADSGAAYVFERNTGGTDDWGEVTNLAALDAAAGDQFGWAVSIDGDALVVGANADDDAGSGSGSSYLFSCLDPMSDPDGDGVPNADDCGPLNGGVWRVPGEAGKLMLAHNDFTAVTSLSWQAPDPGGTTVRYDAVRSNVASDFTTSWFCALSDGLGTAANDSTAVPPGAIRFYLVRGENDCGLGSAGQTSAGVERQVHDCP